MTSGTTANATSGAKGSVNTGNQNTATNSANVGGKVGGGVGGEGEGGQAAIPGIKGGISAGAGSSNTSGTTGGVNVSQENANTTGTSNTNQVQANQRNLIEKEMQQILGGPDEFKNWMRVNALNAENEANMKQIPLSALPPGAVDLAKIDPALTGPEKMLATLDAQRHNNALLAARNEFLYKAARDQLHSGKSYDVESLDKEFVNTDIYKALQNRFEHSQSLAKDSKYQPQFNEGDLWSDNANNILVRRNGKWEKR
jgi:hypothetical protein